MSLIRVTVSDLRAFSYHVYINREYKLLFCTIPKVACSQWMKLFWRMAGAADWNTDPHHREHKPLLSQLSPQEASAIMNAPDWTRAVFFRDPVERLLSAYLDKFVLTESYAAHIFPSVGRYAPFDQFVRKVIDPNNDPSRPEGLHSQTDPHWRPQAYMCRLGKFLPQFNFIGNFAHLREHAKALLEQIGIWRAFGASGWGPAAADELFETNLDPHQTDAACRLSMYYTPELLDQVQRAYQMDYDLFASIGLGAQPVQELPHH